MNTPIPIRRTDPDEEPGHEQVLEQVLTHLLAPPNGAVLEVICEEANLPTLVGDDGWAVAITGVRPVQEELFTEQRGVVVELSDGSGFAMLIQVLRQAQDQTTVVGPE